MANEKLKAALKTAHPEYSARKKAWDFFLIAYEGGENYFSKENIFTHAREDAKDYEFRLKRAHYQNYCESVIGVYTGHLFKKPIVRDAGGLKSLESFWKNVDRSGADINAFMKNVADLMQAMGHVHILIDKPRTNGVVRSKADEVSMGVTPYFSVVYPQNLIDWEVDEDGNYVWVRIEEITNEQDDPFGKRERRVRYRTYTREEWFIHDGNGAVIDAGVHGLGEVPLVTAYNRKLKRYPLFGQSAIEDIAYINRAITNLSSLIDEFAYRQCFDILIYPDNGVPTTEEGEGEIQISTKNLMTIPPDVALQPYYLTPPTEPADFLMRYQMALKTTIFELARTEAPDMQPAEQSGLSKQWSFHETNQSLADKADNLEDAETNATRIYGRWMDAEFDGSIDYPEEFDIRAINEELENALKVKAYGFPQSFLTEYDKTLSKKLLAKLPKEVAAQIERDIEAGKRAGANVSQDEVGAMGQGASGEG